MSTNLGNMSKTVILVIFWLFFFDITIKLLLSFPQLEDSSLKRYFEYGYSVERQLVRMLSTEVSEDSVLHAGWIDSEKYLRNGVSADITFYGMSFSNHIADSISEIEPTWVIRKIAGPAAPLNHSYSAFMLDKDICRSKVSVLGVLDSSLPNIVAMTNDTIGVDSPYGSCYPTYRLSDSGIIRIEPEIGSFSELKAAVNNEHLWIDHLEKLEKYDQHFNRFIYSHTLLDDFIVGRFFVRWLKANHHRRMIKKVHTFEGFIDNSESIELTKALITHFTEVAYLSGTIPFVLLLETQEYGSALSSVLTGYLEEQEIPFLSTHELIPTTDPLNFLPDGHYTSENDFLIADALHNYFLKYFVSL